MTKNTAYILAFTASLIFATSAKAQNENYTPNYHLEILTKTNANSVELRWAPAAKETWQMGNQKGYILERRKADGKGWTVLENVTPYKIADWKTKTDTTDINNAIAAQCLLGKKQAKITTGGPFSQYLLASEEGDNRYGYALMAAEFGKEAARGLALSYTDTDIKKGEIIEYRVFVKQVNLPFSGDTASIRINTNNIYQPHAVTAISTEPNDGNITLHWSREANRQYFSAYYIEKSIDKGKTFKRLNSRPYVKSLDATDGEENNNYSYKDTNVINYKPYQYRIVGITPFGDESLPSEPLLTEGIDLTGPIPPTMIYVTELEEPGTFEITWEATTNAPDHNGFYVGKSQLATGPFDKINENPLSLKTRSFVDDSPSPYSSIYYTVFSVDERGNENMSPVAIGIKSDTIPPAQPLGLTGDVDSVGVVMLAWEMNTEKDLQGYRVYRGNNTNHEFIQLTSDAVPGNFYFDTISLRTLTQDIFYKVVALDYHYNPSPYSEPLKISKPDYIKPASPTIVDYKMSANRVNLKWKTSPSSDAVYQVIYRQKEDEGWTIVKEINNNTDTLFVDSLVQANTFYTYTIVAIDAAGLYSEKANPVKVKVADDGVRPGVSNFVGSFNKSCNCFQINWDFESEEKYHIVIYRDENNTGLRAITTVKAGENIYKDSNIYARENGYKYNVKVVYKNGGESLMSSTVSFVKNK